MDLHQVVAVEEDGRLRAERFIALAEDVLCAANRDILSDDEIDAIRSARRVLIIKHDRLSRATAIPTTQTGGTMTGRRGPPPPGRGDASLD